MLTVQKIISYSCNDVASSAARPAAALHTEMFPCFCVGNRLPGERFTFPVRNCVWSVMDGFRFKID